MTRLLCRRFAWCLAAFVLFTSLVDSVSPVYAAELVATDSDALSDDSALWDFPDLAEYDPLANLTEEQYAAYCQTFVDHPSVFLDYPEGMIQPRFAVTLSAAAVCGLCILAAAVGLVFTWNLSSWVNGYSGYDFFSGFEQYQRINHPEDSEFWSGWDAILGSSWGQIIFGVNPVYDDMKRYCKDEVKGYGTDAPSYDISLGSGGIMELNVLYGEGTEKTFIITEMSSPVYLHVGLRPDEGIVNFYLLSSGYFIYSGKAPTFDGKYYRASPATSFGSLEKAEALYSAYLSYGAIDISEYCGKYKNFYNDVVLQDGFVLGASELTISIIPDKSIVDAQEKDFTSPGNVINLPLDQTAADTLGETVSAATDAAGVAGALTGTWDLGDTQAGTDEEDPVLPWVPDITSWLEKLLHGIDAISNKVSAIPDTLAGLRDDVLSIPGQITDFFIIDTAAVSTAFAGIQESFSSRFPLLDALAPIFSYSGQTFDETPPVFTMQVPDCLKFAYPDTDEIVVLDLRQYAEYFHFARTVVAAGFWLMFAMWVMKEFDIKFHIG